MKITSIHNPLIKEVKKLHTPQIRKQEKKFLLEGAKPMSVALKNKISIEKIFFCPTLLTQVEQQILENLSAKELYEVSEKVIEKLSYRQHPDGLVFIAQAPKTYSLSDLPKTKTPLLIILQGLEKPGNIGAIMRVADAVGVNALCLADPLPDLYNPNIIRSSLGAVFSLPIVTTTSKELQPWLMRHNLEIIATSPSATSTYTDIDYTKGCAIIIGSEKDGLTESWFKVASKHVTIPLHGHVDSLNAATSAAIVLYEALRQRTRELVENQSSIPITTEQHRT